MDDKRFKEYLRRKKLMLKAKKTKMMLFRKRGKEKNVKWELSVLDAVKKCKCLGIWIKNGNSREGKFRFLKKDGGSVKLERKEN